MHALLPYVNMLTVKDLALAKSLDSPSVSTSTDEALILPSLSAPVQVITRRLASVTPCTSTSPPAKRTLTALLSCGMH